MAEATSNTNFISQSQFNQQVNEERINKEETTPWANLPREEIYKVLSIDRRRSIFGECWIMKAIGKDGDEIVCFAPRSLIVYIKDNLTKHRTFYVTPLGQVCSFVLFVCRLFSLNVTAKFATFYYFMKTLFSFIGNF